MQITKLLQLLQFGLALLGHYKTLLTADLFVLDERLHEFFKCCHAGEQRLMIEKTLPVGSFGRRDDIGV
jgi:hypothetical protein